MARTEVRKNTAFPIKLRAVSPSNRKIQIETTVSGSGQLHDHSNSWICGERDVLEDELSASNNGVGALLWIRCLHPQRETRVNGKGQIMRVDRSDLIDTVKEDKY